ncbi:hypothetical protein C2I18_08515 [Paenibacillus sp. PK3_47]|nr:hypothetical protein C2I18_08515 [Paenibacillus sp. PK3_47]
MTIKGGEPGRALPEGRFRQQQLILFLEPLVQGFFFMRRYNTARRIILQFNGLFYSFKGVMFGKIIN